MSPTRRAADITGLRLGLGQSADQSIAAALTAAGKRVSEMTTAEIQELAAPRPKPARVTLNLPPELYRQLARWADSAAETIGVPRVGVQETMRAMIKVITGDEAPSCSARVMAELRSELGRNL